MIGQILGGRYQIQQQLGKGGFGITFTAIDTGRPGNPICIVKQFKPTSTDPFTLNVGKKLFIREAENLEKLGNHDQIPRLLAYFQENQEFYLVQEYIPGHDLSQELITGTQLSETEVIQLLQDVLEVLAFVHQQNLIHRDLKPSNIRRRQTDNKIVLIDFGAVKEISTQVVNTQGQTEYTVVIGTRGYIPSEQAEGKPKLSSDIYAIGIITIQALTGINPYPRGLPIDPNTGEIAWRTQAQVNPKLANILDQMVRYDYRQRYQSATEVLQALKTLSPQAKPVKLWLGVGAVAIITPLIIWLAYQLINPTPQLETYGQPNSLITIKYPSDWQLIKPKTGDFDFGGEVIKFVPKNHKPENSCILEITPNINELPPQSLSLEEYKNSIIQKIKNNNQNPQIIDETQPSTTLSKFSAYRLTYTRQEGQCKFKVLEIGTVSNGKAYFITYSAEEKAYNKYLATAETMINSFLINPQ